MKEEDELYTQEDQDTPESSSNVDNTLNEEPVLDEPASSSSPENPVAAKITKEALQKIFLKLFANPIFWVVVIAIILILFLIILVALDFDFGGTSFNPKYLDYYESVCQSIYLTKEKEEYSINNSGSETYQKVTNPNLVDIENTERFEYETYSINEFVTNIVWQENNKAKDVNNETVYQALAITVRTNLIATLSDNCVVLSDNNSYNFPKLTGNEEKYSEISKAVNDTTGIIMVKDDKPFPTKIDIFTYNKRREENNGYDYLYYMQYVNEQSEQVIPSKWVLENVPSDLIKWSPTKAKLEYFSIYGAKYLAEKEGQAYTPQRLVEYYFGKNIKYKTIDFAFSESYEVGCSQIAMNQTSLTKSQFITLVQNDANKRGAKAKELAQYADKIYDIAVNNNVNPELVIIRAAIEGYSPGASKNNYWGLGCTNTGGYNACISYASIDEGIMGFINFVSKFNSLTELMSKYAYLGDYWYNPGSSSVGGCYYAPYIFDTLPEHVRQACAVNNPCTTAKESTCVATTEEDKNAYLVYQSQSMIRFRKDIFGLDADSCNSDYQIGEVGNGKCTIYNQNDPRWSKIKLGTSNFNMGNSGCAVTAIAIAITCSGTPINNVAAFNPGVFVNRLNQTNGFINGSIYWNANAINYYAPNFKYVDTKTISGTDEEKLAAINNLIKNNTILLPHFKNDAHPRGHWVVLKSIEGKNIIVYDPAGGKVNQYNIKDMDSVTIYKF